MLKPNHLIRIFLEAIMLSSMIVAIYCLMLFAFVGAGAI